MFPGDLLLPDMKLWGSVENYYPALCQFFSQIEEKLGGQVCIAAHPKSDHGDRPAYFGGRPVFKNQTFQMVRDCRFLITHASTAIGYAVIYRKPVVFITTNEAEKDIKFSVEIAESARSLGKAAVNIDSPLSIDWEAELQVNYPMYEEYMNSYVKKSGSENLNTWQIFSNRIKRFK
ncbi:MAG: hypothetical protein G3M78_01030 [Candidatus Nitrohelix vancouverensis]|uniref:Uncharacterized protein n=1 Tax=Candidatus Nitrohelix vancouverensis TaxID=2705534 RepID=A0A7T0C028_9BACT|nr:MAG: hypothetical protein G3M78_01030 [Candidatus Nitrohelix vancouverensis]